MSNKTELIRQIRDALTHLYDYAYLQRHPLADRLAPPQVATTQTRAQELRRILLDAVEALNPGDSVPIRAAERRGYAILFGLYIEGRGRHDVAASLGISGRQLRRDRSEAFEALASILRDRYLIAAPVGQSSEEPLRSESERLAQQREPVNLSDLAGGLVPLLQPLAQERGIHLISRIEPGLARPWVNRMLIRQVLIGLASHALAGLPIVQLSFEARASETGIEVGLGLRYRRGHLQVEGGFPSLTAVLKSVETLVGALESSIRQEPASDEEEVIWVVTPHQAEMLVLVVDDNHELFALFQRYVAGEPYRLIHAASVDEATALLRSTRPDAIILDLMMPDRDGWELLQLLRSDPKTSHIPIVVCSILDDSELAFSWGAQAYLKKPVGSLELLQALAAAVRMMNDEG
jgi:CheY-like chemotaxis protein